MDKIVAVDVKSPPATADTPKQSPGTATPVSGLTDGRSVGDWKSRWPTRVWVQVCIEASYIVGVTVFAFWMLYAGWSGGAAEWLSVPDEKKLEFSRCWLYSFAGLLGGVLFGIKWLYHSVAKGLWNVDRVLWRVLSPLMSFCIAFAVSFMTAGGALGKVGAENTAGWITFGFLVGLFSDTAMGKMQEIVYVLFGSPKSDKKEGS
jgi:hypothetical protein